MSLNEIFPNPTVKQVIYQIRFPCMFSMESLIGNYQLQIMEKFPKSRLILSKQFLIGELPESSLSKALSDDENVSAVKKIWKFTTESGVELSVQVDSLDITSKLHKTYNNPKSKERFRDIIKFALDNFFDVTQIPKINRIGLRYIDECPVPSRGNVSFRKYYNTSLPIKRFPLKNAINMSFTACVKKGKYFLTFRESLIEKENGKFELILDFDGYAKAIKASDYLSITDNLHDLIVDEYKASIKEPVYRYMRQNKST